MSNITFQNGPDGRKYIIFHTSYLDETEKKLKKTQMLIGKIDKKTGEPVFNKKYYELIDTNTDLINVVKDKFPNINQDIILNSNLKTTNLDNKTTKDKIDIKDFNIINKLPYDEDFEPTKMFGYLYFMMNIANQIKLLDTLKIAFRHEWDTIFILSCYIIKEFKSPVGLDNWVNYHYINILNKSLSNANFSELLKRGVPEYEIDNFYYYWAQTIKDKDCLALNMPKVSTYVNNAMNNLFNTKSDIENSYTFDTYWLFGAKSQLPIFQTIYSGDIRDSQTIRDLLEQFTPMVRKSRINFVMQRNFYGIKNLKFLINYNLPFIVAVPFKSNKVIELIENYSDSICEHSKIIQTYSDTVKYVSYQTRWANYAYLNLHIFFDANRYMAAKNIIDFDIRDMANEYLKYNNKEILNNEYFKKFIIIDNNYPLGHQKHLTFSYDGINKFLKTTGWLILITDTTFDSQKIFRLYNLKDWVRKSIHSYSCLDTFNLSMDTDLENKNKLFNTFICLILESHLNKLLSENDLRYSFTLEDIFHEISMIDCYIDDNKYLHVQPLTKDQKIIFDAFKIKYPKGVYSKNDFF